MAESNPRPNGQSRSSNRRRAPGLTATTADRHDLYQRSVQDADNEVAFIDRVFKRLVGRVPVSLREDFCGTALLTQTWVRGGRHRRGIGVDIDQAVLDWGWTHNMARLGKESRRVTLRCQDVRGPIRGRVDVVAALNFSYWVFVTRHEMRAYFGRVRRGLRSDGLFLLDAYGGWESQQPVVEPRSVRGGFTYVWDQELFDPITHRVRNHIHFRFRDGSKLERAFTYDWRYWTLPEVSELLLEAGYSDVMVYWDTSEDDQRESYRACQRAKNRPGWLAYVVARP